MVKRSTLVLTNPDQIKFYEHLKLRYGERVAYRYARVCLFPTRGGGSHHIKP